MAELIGILIGDGYVYTNKGKYIVGFTGNPITDKEYYFYIKDLIKETWHKDVNPKVRSRGIRIVLNSKIIVHYLDRLGLTYGKNKSETIFIPPCIYDNNLTQHTLRGIVDTDGSVFSAKKPGVAHYPSIEITTSSLKLASQIKDILMNKGFHVPNIWSYKSKLSKRLSYKVPLNGFDNLRLWLKKIGFSNPYKLNKARKILEMGRG